MIYFNINIRNPLWWDRWANIKNWAGKPTKNHKCWEVQITKCAELFRIEFEWTVRQDHAGVNSELGLLGYALHLTWYDTRHWHPEKNRWIDYSNSKELEELYGKSWTGEK